MANKGNSREAPSSRENAQSVYSGRALCGNIVKSRGQFIGYNQAGRKVGKYATAAEAMAAVLAAPATAS